MPLDVPVLQVRCTATYTAAADVASSIPSFPIDEIASTPLSTGTGANQADKIYTLPFNIAASGTQNFDLAGSLTDKYGVTITMARLKAVVVRADKTNTNDVQVSRPAANGVPLFLAASDAIPVRPGGFFAWSAPDATAIVVTAGTGDLLTLTNSAGGTAVTGDIILIGSSA